MAWLGLDVGGTHCRYEWWPDGVHPGGRTAGVQPAVHGIEATVAGLAAALQAAAAAAGVEPEAAVAALAGAGDPTVAAAIVDGVRAAGIGHPLAVVGDVVAAAAAALAEQPGVLLWSGTGSFAVARAEDGELHRVGGRGYLLGDQGSGFDLVRRAAAAVLMAVDGLGPATEMAARLPAALGAPSPERLGAVLQQHDPGAVAAHLPLVVEIAADGDAVAGRVLEEGAEALALLAAGAARAADLDPRGRTVALGGGVLTAVPAIADFATQRLLALGFARVTSLDELAAARGAAWLAHGSDCGLEPQRSWVQRVAL